MKTTRYRSKKQQKASRKGRAAVVKQKKGEKETADILRKVLEDVPEVEVVQRNQGKWSGKYRPEVAVIPRGNYHDPYVHIENKRDNKIGLRSAFLQALADHKQGSVPLAVVKRDYEPEIVVIWLHDLTPMLRAWLKENAGGE